MDLSLLEAIHRSMSSSPALIDEKIHTCMGRWIGHINDTGMCAGHIAASAPPETSIKDLKNACEKMQSVIKVRDVANLCTQKVQVEKTFWDHIFPLQATPPAEASYLSSESSFALPASSLSAPRFASSSSLLSRQNSAQNPIWKPAPQRYLNSSTPIAVPPVGLVGTVQQTSSQEILSPYSTSQQQQEQDYRGCRAVPEKPFVSDGQ